MLQIKHQHNTVNLFALREKCTFAIDVFPKRLLQTLVEHGINTLPVKLGVTFLHPKDQYNKKIGRQLAEEKVKVYDAKLLEITIREQNRVVFNFMVDIDYPKTNRIDYKARVTFGISYIPSNQNTRLEYIEL